MQCPGCLASQRLLWGSQSRQKGSALTVFTQHRPLKDVGVTVRCMVQQGCSHKGGAAEGW